MIGCPNCGNKLVFDIDSQKMRCKYCDSYYLISVASKWSKDAEEQKTEDSDNSMEITNESITEIKYYDAKVTGLVQKCRRQVACHLLHTLLAEIVCRGVGRT